MRPTNEKVWFRHGDHIAYVMDVPREEAMVRGLAGAMELPGGARLGGDMIAFSVCEKCGWKKASSMVAVPHLSPEDDQKIRTKMAISMFMKDAPESCARARELVIASSVIES